MSQIVALHKVTLHKEKYYCTKETSLHKDVFFLIVLQSAIGTRLKKLHVLCVALVIETMLTNDRDTLIAA